MTNTKKLIVLGVLVIFLAVFVFLYLDKRAEFDKLIAEKERDRNTVEIVPEEKEIVAPDITMNASINQKLSSFKYKNSIIDQAIVVAQKYVNEQIEQSTALNDATISDIEFVDFDVEGINDSIDMFRVHLTATLESGKKVSDDTNYLIFYKRWYDDLKDAYFVINITQAEIEDKYSEVATEYGDNVLVAACVKESEEYLKTYPHYTGEELLSVAQSKALLYNSHFKVAEIIVPEDYIIHEYDGIKTFLIGTDILDLTIGVSFKQIDEEKWIFLNAFH